MNGNSRTAGKGNRKTDVCSGRSGKRSPRYMGQQKEVEPCPGKRREKIVSLQVFRATQKLPRKGLDIISLCSMSSVQYLHRRHIQVREFP